MKNYSGERGFYNQEEVQTVLGKSETEVKQLVNDGTLLRLRRGGQFSYEILNVQSLTDKTPDQIALSLYRSHEKKSSCSGSSMKPLRPVIDDRLCR